jgi:RNA polymerase sigma-70 factor (ECF subfamily)
MADKEQSSASDSFGQDICAIASSRDRQAFARLFAHFAPRIKGFLMRRGASAAAAEDLAQEALMTVWRKASYFDPARAGASTWIFTIVRNLQIDQQRRETRAALYAAAGPDDVEPPEQPDEVLSLSEREERVRRAMIDLPPDQLAVVKLSFVEGRAHADIASALDIPLGTVKSRMRLAMNKLRGILEDLA